MTATVTDRKGGSASASANITVNLGAEARHFGDILFPDNSARVNNCGKRVLIEQLYPLLAGNPNYDVVLVGHIDSSEAPTGRGSRRGRDLDRNRVLNTAAVLSGGSGTCSSLDPSRIKGSWDWSDAGDAIRADFLRRVHHGSQGAPWPGDGRHRCLQESPGGNLAGSERHGSAGHDA